MPNPTSFWGDKIEGRVSSCPALGLCEKPSPTSEDAQHGMACTCTRSNPG